MDIPDTAQSLEKNIRCLQLGKSIDIRIPLRSQCVVDPISGYYLVTTGTENYMFPCPRYCVSCNFLSLCTSCETGYYIKDGGCLPCHSSCSTCVYHAINCLQCSDSSPVKTFEVEQTIKTYQVCDHCFKEGCDLCVYDVCIFCTTGYKLDANECLDCALSVNKLICFGSPVLNPPSSNPTPVPSLPPGYDPDSKCIYRFTFNVDRQVCEPSDLCAYYSSLGTIDMALCSFCIENTSNMLGFLNCNFRFDEFSEFSSYLIEKDEDFEIWKNYDPYVTKHEISYNSVISERDDDVLKEPVNVDKNCLYFNESLQICQLCSSFYFYKAVSKKCESCSANCQMCESAQVCLICKSQFEILRMSEFENKCRKVAKQTIQVDTSLCEKIIGIKSEISQISQKDDTEFTENCESLDCSKCKICQINEFPICGNCPKCKNDMGILVSNLNNTSVEIKFTKNITFLSNFTPETISNLTIDDVVLEEKIRKLIDLNLETDYQKRIFSMTAQDLNERLFVEKPAELGKKMMKVEVPLQQSNRNNNSIFIFRKMRIGKTYPLKIKIGKKTFVLFNKEENSDPNVSVSLKDLVLNPSKVLDNMHNPKDINAKFISTESSSGASSDPALIKNCGKIRISVIQIRVKHIEISVDKLILKPIRIYLFEKLQCEEMVKERTLKQLITQTSYTSFWIVIGKCLYRQSGLLNEIMNS